MKMRDCWENECRAWLVGLVTGFFLGFMFGLIITE